MFLIFFQLFCLIAISLGWTYWLHKWTTHGVWKWRSAVVLFSAAFATQILLLQNMTYLDIPVQKGALLPVAIGLWGLWGLFSVWRKGSPFDNSFRRNLRYGTAIFFVVFSIQSYSAIVHGPENYYGKAHVDHLNYALVAEFIRTEPFSTPESEMQKQPWLLKVSQQKGNRIGQSVAQAYIASLSFVSAKEAYAGLCSFFVALLALVVFVLAQSFSLGRPYCILAAIWVGLAPATTGIHLDGFLSQAAVLFIFPVFILHSRFTEGRTRFKILIGSVFLSYLLVCYTDFFPIGIVLLTLVTAALCTIWSRLQIVFSFLTLLFSLFLVPGYLPNAVQFVVGQYSYAAAVNQAVEVLAPDGGTVYGWTQSLIQIPLAAGDTGRQATTALGLLLFALGAAGLFSRSRRHRLFALVTVLTPAIFLGVLLSAHVLAKYPFQKICDSFAFAWILVIMRGICLLTATARRRWAGPLPAVNYALPGLLLLLGCFGCFAQHRFISTRFESLALLDTPEFRKTLQYVAAHKDRAYAIRHPHGVVAGWIAYEARQSRVFILSNQLSDIPIFPGQQAFSVLPDVLDRVTFIDTVGFRDETTSAGAPDIAVDNPQGQDVFVGGAWYWLGDSLNVECFDWSGTKPQEYSLTFQAEPGPANPSPLRTISVTNLRTGQREFLSFRGATKLVIPVMLAGGKNTLRIESVDPRDEVYKTPNDPRLLLSRLFNFKLSDPKPVGARDPRFLQMSSRNSVPLPVVTPHNPQLEDRGETESWYWVGKEMELEITRTDKLDQTSGYELTFDAEAGPANPDPHRKIRIHGSADKRVTDIAFDFKTKPVVFFTAAPGTTRLRIEVLSPTEQTVKLANDPRNHMVRASNFRVNLIGSTPVRSAAPAAR
jgi:hypothetical protein